jgi:hypothetical protein
MKRVLFVALMTMAILALGLAACSPAQTATPPATTMPPAITTPPAAPAAVDVKTSFEAVTYTNDEYGFTIKYPKTWFINEGGLPGGVFRAMLDNDVVFIVVKPATDFKVAATEVFTYLIKANGLSASPSVDAETAVTMADGKTKGYEILLSATVSGQTAAKAAVCGVIKDGNAILVTGASVPKNIELYIEIGKTLSVQ